MSNKKYADIVLALAGIAQAADLVHQFANSGQCDENAFASLIESIYQIDAQDVESVYQGAANLKPGLLTLQRILSRQNKADQFVGRYMIGLSHLAKLLQKDKAQMTQLSKKLNYAISQAEFFSKTHPTVISSLSHIYMETLGKMRFKIQVLGKKQILTVEYNMDKIRALLLAGVRSAVLWRQIGGNQWQLIFSRPALHRAVNECLAKIESD